MKSRGCSVIVRQTTYVLFAGLILVGCGKKGFLPIPAADVVSGVGVEELVSESVLEPLSVLEPDSLGSLLEASEELANLQALQFEQQEQEIEAIQQEVEVIRKQLVLERYQKLEAEAKKKGWHRRKHKPEHRKEAKRFDEWRYIQQRSVDLGLPKIEVVPFKGMQTAEKPVWRKRGD